MYCIETGIKQITSILSQYPASRYVESLLLFYDQARNHISSTKKKCVSYNTCHYDAFVTHFVTSRHDIDVLPPSRIFIHVE